MVYIQVCVILGSVLTCKMNEINTYSVTGRRITKVTIFVYKLSWTLSITITARKVQMKEVKNIRKLRRL